jgi:hypothetical protein
MSISATKYALWQALFIARLLVSTSGFGVTGTVTLHNVGFIDSLLFVLLYMI